MLAAGRVCNMTLMYYTENVYSILSGATYPGSYKLVIEAEFVKLTRSALWRRTSSPPSLLYQQLFQAPTSLSMLACSEYYKITFREIT